MFGVLGRPILLLFDAGRRKEPTESPLSIAHPYHREGVYHHEGSKFLLLATLAVERCEETGFAINAPVAQIMAAVAAEAFIDEFAFVLSTLRIIKKGLELARVGAILEQLEVSRVQVTEKFKIASQLLPGNAFDAGHQPFQSFNQLIKLRNYLVHPKVVPKPPGWFSYFVSNGLITQKPDAKFIFPEWTAQLQNKQCASWACRATARIVLDLIARLQEPCDTNNVPGIYEMLLTSWEWAKTDRRIWSGQSLDSI